MDWSGRLLDSRGNSETGEPLHGGSGSALAHRKASSLQRKSFFTFHINSMDGFVFQHYESNLGDARLLFLLIKIKNIVFQ